MIIIIIIIIIITTAKDFVKFHKENNTQGDLTFRMLQHTFSKVSVIFLLKSYLNTTAMLSLY